MKKISKILVVVLSLALLCGMLTTMLSAADSGIAFPTYSKPTAAVQKGFLDFEDGTPRETEAEKGFAKNTSSTVVQGTSKYDQYSFDQSTVESYANTNGHTFVDISSIQN